MRPVLAIILVCALVTPASAQRLSLDPPGTSAAPDPAAWRPLETSGPAALSAEKTPDGKPAVAFPCDMAAAPSRVYWDRAVRLDLTGYSRITFWMKVTGDPTAVGSCTLYFNAGAGWYGAPFGPQEGGWNRIVLDRASFKPEDTPEGWQAIRGIRIAFWKGTDRRATVLLGGLEATTSPVAVVLNERAGPESRTYVEQMVEALSRAGIDAGTVSDADVERGALKGRHIAVYPQNPQPSEGELAALDAFVKGGGKLLVCYALPPRIGELLGVRLVDYIRQDRPGQFAAMRFPAPRLPGLPPEARQASWNINRVEPAGHNARVIARWVDQQGKDTGYPAIVLSDTGAYLSHVLLADDPANKDRLLRGVLGHLDPGLWRDAAAAAVENAGRIGARFETFAEAEARVRQVAQANDRVTRIQEDTAKARFAYDQATRNLKAARYAECLDAADAARASLVTAYALAQAPEPREFRAVWCHNAYSVEGLTWDQAIERLKVDGFTAIVPNMLWGGVADYKSEVLPVRDRVAKEGDQIALCVAAAKKYGIQVHVWKVNWNLGGAPADFVERMRREQRLQRSSTGAEEPWLCPSNPANFELERASMLEVARKYDVDGIHFDYIRYPDSAHCYCDGCRKRFEALQGKPVANWPRDVLRGGPQYAAYQDFRRTNITRLVKAVSEEAHRLKPGIKVSAAVFPDWPQCRDEVGQDWAAWVKAGYLDFVCPMDYSASDSGFRARVQVQREAVGGRIPFYPGIGASAPGLPLGQVIDQIRITREEGTKGFIIFNYDARTATDVIPPLARGITSQIGGLR